jgi:hypothetical protein
MTEYQGRRVPRDVLQTVYRAAGMELDFDEGGRDMELGPGHAAWDVLEAWRGEVADDTDAEDHFFLNGAEDDDLIDEQEP